MSSIRCTHATRAAVEEGIVPGGGVALVRAQKALDNLTLEGDEAIGANIVRRAIQAPLRQLADNAGLEGALIVQEVKKRKGNEGLNIATGEYVDLVKAGVVDPTKVTRSALQNASSISALLLTTEALITEIPEKEKPAPMPPAGAMSQFTNLLESITTATGATVTYAHHFTKGSQYLKDPIDRLSGSGVFGRDADTIVTLLEHQMPKCFILEAVLRNLPEPQPFVVERKYPLIVRRGDLRSQKGSVPYFIILGKVATRFDCFGRFPLPPREHCRQIATNNYRVYREIH